MTQAELIAMVEDYFAAVDRKDLSGTLSFLAPDCVFTIETAELRHEGRDTGVKAMFERLFARWETIWHGNFRYVADAPRGRIACQFDVRNIAPDGSVDEKHNCNFFTIRDGLFHRVSIYMSGENTLR